VLKNNKPVLYHYLIVKEQGQGQTALPPKPLLEGERK